MLIKETTSHLIVPFDTEKSSLNPFIDQVGKQKDYQSTEEPPYL
ncbi:hypothetical protein FTV88_2425 [Heliorestis convoluta]|uniref:Uncharacterized protein n=1 Tax=Heliorestis convoluta TaxID=356322 RepID=A0A5Q2N3Q7_9FIRM|nr:hypothetical protein FTV88_2425 [Heliorestis convoluta]